MADTAVAPDQQETVADALARRVQAGEDPSANRLVRALRELGAVDRAVYEAVARTPTATLDGPVRQLSGAADNSRLWLGIARLWLGIAAAGRPGRGRARPPGGAGGGGGHRRHLGRGQLGVKPIACWPPPSPTPGSTTRATW
jgi:hypothetical protein